MCGAGALAREWCHSINTVSLRVPEFTTCRCLCVTDGNCRFNYSVGSCGAGRPPHKTHQIHTVSSRATPLAKYRYRRRLPHLQKADADLFVTFCTGGPLVLSSAARDLVLEHCLREAGLRPFAGEGARATPRHSFARGGHHARSRAPAAFNPCGIARAGRFRLVDILAMPEKRDGAPHQ